MNMFKTLFALAASAFLLISSASAQGFLNFERTDGYIYASGFVGASFPDDINSVDLDNDVYYGGALGAQLPFKSLGFVHTRIEVEVSYFETSIDGVAAAVVPAPQTPSVDNLFIFGNSFADLIWRENQAVIPYIGGGLGLAITDTDFTGSDTNFASHSAIGLTVPINKLDIYAEGRYFQIFVDGPNADGFTLSGGLRFKF